MRGDPRTLHARAPDEQRTPRPTKTPPNLALGRRATAEFLGTGLLLTIVVGSGIAAERLFSDDPGLQLLESSLATGLGLTVLICVLAPVSGAHLNPVVTLANLLLGTAARPVQVTVYLVAQVAGAVAGSLLADAMFGAATGVSDIARVTPGAMLGEVVATAGLVLVVFGLIRAGRALLVAPAVGAYIGAAYWFTSSTSFANPAVTIGRVLTPTSTGIAPGSGLVFILMQLLGGAVGVALTLWLFPPARRPGAARPGTPPA